MMPQQLSLEGERKRVRADRQTSKHSRTEAESVERRQSRTEPRRHVFDAP
jgi:hypothetical protein